MRWTETISVDQPLVVVRRAVADAHVLITWSAWPEATGYTCTVEGDGTTVGSTIVFTDRAGTEQGRQRLVSVSGSRVDYQLRNRGPAGREMTPTVTYRLEEVEPARTRVHLDFEAHVPLPWGSRQVAEALLGRRVRALHVQDLRQLKAQLEAPAAAV